MNRSGYLLCLLTAWGAGLPAFAQDDIGAVTGILQRLTLTDAYTLAVAHSESLSISDEEWRAAESRYRQARSEFLPALDVDGSLQWSRVNTDSSAGRTTRAGLAGSYTIFSGFRTTRLVAARAADVEAAGYDVRHQHQLLFEDVSDVFYQVLSDEQELTALSAEMQSIQERIDELQRRIKLGRSRPAELLSAQAQLADAHVTRQELCTARDAARELMSFLVGEPASTYALVDETTLPTPGQIERFLKAVDQRPDVLAAEARARAASADTKAAESDRNISLGVDGDLYAVSDPGKAGDWDVALHATLPVFDDGLRRAKTAEQRANQRVSELQLDQLRRTATRDVRMAYRDATGKLAEWAALQDALQVASANLELQKKDYATGRASNLDVVSALTQLSELRRREAVLTMQTKASVVRLHVAAGMEQQP